MRSRGEFAQIARGFRMPAGRRSMIDRLGVVRIAAGAVVLVGSFAGALWALDAFFPVAASQPPTPLETRPLQPATRTSTITAPIAVALTAIRDAMEARAPRNLTGKGDNPLTQLLGKADIGWTLTRGPFVVVGRSEALTVTTALNGTLRLTGQVASRAGNVSGALGNLVNSDVGHGLQNIAARTLDQRADLRGTVAVSARPIIDNNWRIEPNLSAQVAMGASALSIAGVKAEVGDQVKPLLDRTVNEQVAALTARIRNDPAIELAARREWAKMCRSISLKGVGENAPDLWLEVRPTGAFAAQPRIDASAVTLTLGVQPQTVSQPDAGRVAIGVPIDVPFTEVNRIVEAQLKGRSFADDGAGSLAITVLGAPLPPAGAPLLISLRVQARERKTFLGVGAEATVYVWGRPVLDRERQILRLADVTPAVQSQAAFGLLGAAAKAAMPYLQSAIADNAVIDLKPFAASAQQSIGAALAEFRQAEPGLQVDANITSLQLVEIEYDAKILRIVAEAQGTVQAAVTALPK